MIRAQRTVWWLCCGGVMAGCLVNALITQRPATAAPNPNGDPFVSLQSQINACQQAIAAQQNVIDALVDRMVFDSDEEWIGWRDMTLEGSTRFTNGGETLVQIGGADGPIVRIDNSEASPLRVAIDAYGRVSVQPPVDSIALSVQGTTQMFGQDESDALQVNGKSLFRSYEPTDAYQPAMEVLGPAWFRAQPNAEIGVRLNPASDPAYVAAFHGPSVFSDADENRWLALFRHPSRPITLERFVDTPFVQSPFYVELLPGSAQATVNAHSFVEE